MSEPFPEPLTLDQLNSINVGLLPTEREQIMAISEQAKESNTEAKVAVTLAAAFIAYRLYASRAAKAAGLEKITQAHQVTKMNHLIWYAYQPYFKLMVAPLFVNSIPSKAARAMPAAMRMQLANDYAARLGEYFTTTSAEAMTTGFTAFVNRKAPPRVAAERAFMSWGLTTRQTNGWVATNFDPKKLTSVITNPRRAARNYLLTAFEQRIRKLSKHEAYVISQEGMQVGWLWQVKMGEIAEDTEKVWLTADDERVCEICGPMHMKRVKVTEHFILPGGEKVWVPGVHPKCRCTSRLSIKTRDRVGVGKGLIAKALSGQERIQFNRRVKRDNKGRFATQNTLRDPGLSAAQRARDTETRAEQLSRGLHLQAVPQEKPGLTKPTGLMRTMGLTNAGLTAPQGLKNPSAIEQEIKLTSPDQALTRAGMQLKREQRSLERVKSLGEWAGLSAVAAAEALDRSAPRATGVTSLTEPLWAVRRSDAILDEFDDEEPETVMEGGSIVRMNLRPREDSRYQFGPSQDLEIGVAREVTDMVNLKVHDLIGSQHLEDAIEPVEVLDSQHAEGDNVGRRGKPFLDQLLLNEVVAAAAHNYVWDDDLFEYADESLEYRPDGALVELYDANGTYIGDGFVKYEEIGKQLGLDPEDFTVRIFRAQDVHRGVQFASGSEHGFEDWGISGAYDATQKHVYQDERGITIEMYDLDPRDED